SAGCNADEKSRSRGVYEGAGSGEVICACRQYVAASRNGARDEGFVPGAMRCYTRSRLYGGTPTSFSMSAIIGCVRPALRNSAKSSTITRSHNLSYGETVSPLWAR